MRVVFLGFKRGDKYFFLTLCCTAANELRKDEKLQGEIYDLFIEFFFSLASKLYLYSVCSVLLYGVRLREGSSYSG